MRAWLPFAFLLLPACASERTVLASHLQECGLLTEGDRAASALRDVYLPTACYEDCFARASCEALEGALCRTSLELLFACDQACAFRCGDGSIVGTERRCNGNNDCADGRDEQGCTNLVHCADGSMRTGVRCNGSQIATTTPTNWDALGPRAAGAHCPYARDATATSIAQTSPMNASAQPIVAMTERPSRFAATRAATATATAWTDPMKRAARASR